jgi:uncharacterized protein YndB with AHSA1/START domain
MLVAWRVPDDMQGYMHAFDARAGGIYRMSLVYVDPQRASDGKSAASTDTFQGRFVELVPGEKIVEIVEFESAEARFAREMRITTLLREVAQETEVTLRFDGIPAGISPEDNETGTQQSLRKLAGLVE